MAGEKKDRILNKNRNDVDVYGFHTRDSLRRRLEEMPADDFFIEVDIGPDAGTGDGTGMMGGDPDA